MQVASSGPLSQQVAPTADYTIGGKNFQVIAASVTIGSNGTLVVRLANDESSLYTIADAVRIESVGGGPSESLTLVISAAEISEAAGTAATTATVLSLIHISEPTRPY